MTFDVIGIMGQAWNVSDVPRMSPSEEATVVAWFVWIPNVHPIWDCYMFAVISLDSIPGVPDAYKKYPEATWEFGVYALNPEMSPSPENYGTWGPMLPPNITVQFDGCSKEKAIELCWLVVNAALAGHLPVEPDDFDGARKAWKECIWNTVHCQKH